MNKSGNLPALSEYAALRYFNFIALYMAQGIPEGMLLFGIPAWMAMNGKTPGQIGAFAATVALSWAFKIVIAPVMDRFSYLPMGRRRPWVLFGQLGLVVSFIALALVPYPLNNLPVFMKAAFVVSFFGAFQDVATDGMAVDIIPTNQQARANGLMWGSKIIGTSVSLAVGSWMLQQYGYTEAILSLSAAVGLIMLVPIILKERPGEKLLPWIKGVASPENYKLQLASWGTLFKSLFSVFTLRNSLLVATMGFITQGSYNYLDTLLPIFTVQSLGWSNVTYAKFFATAGITGGISGMLLGGILIDKFGKIRMMNIYFFLLICLIGSMALFKVYWVETAFIKGFMITYQILNTFATIGLFSIIMECCWKKVSATQFTLYMTCSNLGRSAGVVLIGPIKSLLSWQYTLLAFGGMIALAWLIIQFLRLSTHTNQVEALQLADMDRVNKESELVLA
jgi:MFS transporter, PAT family, beta-lactamase induction signal transducer AmpG